MADEKNSGSNGGSMYRPFGMMPGSSVKQVVSSKDELSMPNKHRNKSAGNRALLYLLFSFTTALLTWAFNPIIGRASIVIPAMVLMGFLIRYLRYGVEWTWDHITSIMGPTGVVGLVAGAIWLNSGGHLGANFWRLIISLWVSGGLIYSLLEPTIRAYLRHDGEISDPSASHRPRAAITWPQAISPWDDPEEILRIINSKDATQQAAPVLDDAQIQDLIDDGVSAALERARARRPLVLSTKWPSTLVRAKQLAAVEDGEAGEEAQAEFNAALDDVLSADFPPLLEMFIVHAANVQSLARETMCALRMPDGSVLSQKSNGWAGCIDWLIGNGYVEKIGTGYEWAEGDNGISWRPSTVLVDLSHRGKTPLPQLEDSLPPDSTPPERTNGG